MRWIALAAVLVAVIAGACAPQPSPTTAATAAPTAARSAWTEDAAIRLCVVDAMEQTLDTSLAIFFHDSGQADFDATLVDVTSLIADLRMIRDIVRQDVAGPHQPAVEGLRKIEAAYGSAFSDFAAGVRADDSDKVDAALAHIGQGMRTAAASRNEVVRLMAEMTAAGFACPA